MNVLCVGCGKITNGSKNTFEQVLEYAKDKTINGKTRPSLVEEKALCDNCVTSRPLDKSRGNCDICGKEIATFSATTSEARYDLDYLKEKLGKNICLSCADEVIDLNAIRHKRQEARRILSPVFDKNTYKECLHKLTYGVEIETSAVNCQLKNEHWERKTDGSITGMEFTSPILKGDKGFENIKNFLSGLDAQVDVRCGLHVHIGVPTLDINNTIKIYNMYVKLAKYLYKLVPTERLKNIHCKPWPQEMIKAGYVSEIGGVTALRGWVNFRNLRRNGEDNYGKNTVEIRYHQGTLSYSEIVNWINLHGRLIEWVSSVDSDTMKAELATIKNINDFAMFIVKTVSLKTAIFYHEMIFGHSLSIIKKETKPLYASISNVERVKEEIERLMVKRVPEQADTDRLNVMSTESI